MWVPVQGRGGTGLSLTQRDLPGQVPDLMSAWACGSVRSRYCFQGRGVFRETVS